MPPRGKMGGKLEKPKDTKRTLLRLAKYLGHQKYLLLNC